MTKTRRRKVSTTVYLEPEQADELDRLSEDLGIPMAVMIRRGVDVAIAEHDEMAEAERARRGDDV